MQKVRKDLQHRHEQRRLRREHHNAGISRFRATQRLRPRETDPRSMDRTVDRHSSDNTRTVLPRHPPGKTGESTASSSFPHQSLSSEAPTIASRLGDECAHFAWGPDLGLGAASTLASPLYTLVDRCTIQLPNGSWEWRYRGRYLNGSLSDFITESKCLDSFSPMQLDIFHALWEPYQPPLHRSRLAAKSTSSERLAAKRAHALQSL